MAATAQPSASCEAYNVVNSAAPFIISCSAKKKKKTPEVTCTGNYNKCETR